MGIATNIKIFSFFSGAGFLDLGFENAGFHISYVNELSEDFLSAYKHSRASMKKEAPEYGFDQSNIRSHFWGKKRIQLKSMVREARRTAGAIGFIGGPPCPDFSTCGLNNGRAGSAGKLSSAYVNLITQQQPDFFVFENVKGLYQTKKHRIFFEHLKERLHRSGYATSEHVLNALEYGAPQHRERLIFVGFKRDLLPSGATLENQINPNFIRWDREKKYSMPDILSCKWPDSTPFSEFSSIRRPRDVIDALTVENWFRQNGVSEHPNTHHRFVPKAEQKFRGMPEGDLSGKSFKRLHRWRFSPTACYGNNEVHLHPYEARRISVAEALAIQSMPKNFSLPPDMSLTSMFKTIGNGVPFLAARGVANTMRRIVKEI